MACSYTREQIEQIIASGKSVIINGQHIIDAKDIPSETELAQGDAARLKTALENAQAKKDAADAELAEAHAKLAETAKAAPKDAPKEDEGGKFAAGSEPAKPPLLVGKKKSVE